MAVTPLAPATFAPTPVAPVPVAVDPSVTVAPPVASSQSGGADTATSEQSTSQKLPLEKALDEINEQMKAWSTHCSSRSTPTCTRWWCPWLTPNQGTSYAPSRVKPY